MGRVIVPADDKHGKRGRIISEEGQKMNKHSNSKKKMLRNDLTCFGIRAKMAWKVEVY